MIGGTDKNRWSEGLVLQSIGGLYYVETAGAVVECRARGILRQKKIFPVAGDRVNISLLQDGTGVLEEVLPRRNMLSRPPLANLDYQVIVVSTDDPAPNLTVLDTMIALSEHDGIEPLLVMTKTDLAPPTAEPIYRQAGFTVFTVSIHEPTSALPLMETLSGKISAFTGNSGVGKSSLLNLLVPESARAVGETSKKLGRGRHTTRSAELIPLPNGGYIVDTPGFSTLDVSCGALFPPSELADCFREFSKVGACRFQSCTHRREPSCAVREAAQEGRIAPSRYAGYCYLYEQLQERWDNRYNGRNSGENSVKKK